MNEPLKQLECQIELELARAIKRSSLRVRLTLRVIVRQVSVKVGTIIMMIASVTVAKAHTCSCQCECLVAAGVEPQLGVPVAEAAALPRRILVDELCVVRVTMTRTLFFLEAILMIEPPKRHSTPLRAAGSYQG